MDTNSLHPSSFPPLSISSLKTSGLQAPSNNGLWKELLLAQNEKSQEIPLSFIPSDTQEVSFSEEELVDGQKEWQLSLIGHAIGKRPYYGSLLAAIRKRWKFKGNLDLLTLEGDFFLFKFTCQEDYNLVWDHGPCFLNGCPFVFQKWSWDFRPSKESISELPIWIKLPNFPLCCWNESGFSKVASRIGIPLAVDNLTASKARITFARICVQISTSSSLPDSIPINLNGMKFTQEIAYDWKPSPCTQCNTFSHDKHSCPLNPKPQVTTRDRSRGRAPARGYNPAPAANQANTNQRISPQQEPLSSPISEEVPVSRDSPKNDSNIPPPTNTTITDLNHSPILSPPMEEPNISDEEMTSSQEQNEHTTLDTTRGSQTEGVITRSAAASPSRQPNPKETIPKTPRKTLQEGESSKENQILKPTPNKGNKKKGKKPSLSIS